ncbi:MAG: 2-succinyl-6-hydroxy-2,4-cyclohexadiene-1-carboxylate synthase [FCB group bacterium]|nr:2-succinyl-6-hydroxy-2,4-cyclohexadiene-1-carboxylate synthase [FCB group bacterium]
MPGLIQNWNYHSAGKAENTPLVFLHGFMGSCHIWTPTFHQIAGSAHCVALDLPGHGNTEADLEHLDFDSLTDAIIDFIDDQKLNRPLLVGYSLGGRIALHTALKHPEHFRGLVIESASPGIEDEKERITRFDNDSMWGEKLRGGDMRAFLTEWYRQPVFSYLGPEVIEKIINKKSSNDPLKLAEAMLRLSQGIQTPLWDRLAQWKKPTLLVTGELDVKYCRILERAHSLIPDSTLSIIPGAGHIVHLEQSKEFIRVLKSFLDSYIL